MRAAVSISVPGRSPYRSDASRRPRRAMSRSTSPTRASAARTCTSSTATWTHRVTPPAVIGHEMSGRVAAVGEGVDGWAAGDPVTVMPLDCCGLCPACRPGTPTSAIACASSASTRPARCRAAGPCPPTCSSALPARPPARARGPGRADRGRRARRRAGGPAAGRAGPRRRRRADRRADRPRRPPSGRGCPPRRAEPAPACGRRGGWELEAARPRARRLAALVDGLDGRRGRRRGLRGLGAAAGIDRGGRRRWRVRGRLVVVAHPPAADTGRPAPLLLARAHAVGARAVRARRLRGRGDASRRRRRSRPTRLISQIEPLATRRAAFAALESGGERDEGADRLPGPVTASCHPAPVRPRRAARRRHRRAAGHRPGHGRGAGRGRRRHRRRQRAARADGQRGRATGSSRSAAGSPAPGATSPTGRPCAG